MERNLVFSAINDRLLAKVSGQGKLQVDLQSYIGVYATLTSQ